jgi:hypothetical protein
MEGKHLVVLCNLSFGNQTIATHALIDCGATGVAFVDEDFTRHHQIPLTALKNPRSLEVIDGRPISSGDITHVANVNLSVLKHQESLPMFVTKLGHYPIVLGIPWLELHDVAIRFSSRTLTFGSQYCIEHCNLFPTVAYAITTDPPEAAIYSTHTTQTPTSPTPLSTPMSRTPLTSPTPLTTPMAPGAADVADAPDNADVRDTVDVADAIVADAPNDADIPDAADVADAVVAEHHAKRRTEPETNSDRLSRSPLIPACGTQAELDRFFNFPL